MNKLSTGIILICLAAICLGIIHIKNEITSIPEQIDEVIGKQIKTLKDSLPNFETKKEDLKKVCTDFCKLR